MTDEGKRSRGGRLPKDPRGTLTRTIAFRLRNDLHADLTAAAAASQRSISEECEYRLQRSFQREAAVVEMFGHDAHRPLVLALGRVIRMVEPLADEDGDKLQAYAAVIATIEGLAGKRAAELMKEASDGAAQNVAAAVVAVEQGAPLPALTPLKEHYRN